MKKFNNIIQYCKEKENLLWQVTSLFVIQKVRHVSISNINSCHKNLNWKLVIQVGSGIHSKSVGCHQLQIAPNTHSNPHDLDAYRTYSYRTSNLSLERYETYKMGFEIIKYY